MLLPVCKMARGQGGGRSEERRHTLARAQERVELPPATVFMQSHEERIGISCLSTTHFDLDPPPTTAPQVRGLPFYLRLFFCSISSQRKAVVTSSTTSQITLTSADTRPQLDVGGTSTHFRLTDYCLVVDGPRSSERQPAKSQQWTSFIWEGKKLCECSRQEIARAPFC